jgi:hypothetical protein
MNEVSILTIEARSSDVLTCSFTAAEARELSHLLRIGYDAVPPAIRAKWVGGVIQRLSDFAASRIDYPTVDA